MMKNIYLTSISIILGLLLLSACANVFDPIPVQQKGEGGLRISIASEGAGARTLYPSARFTSYRLEFTGPSAYGPLTLTGEESITLNDIPNGTWTVKAIGYVMINGTSYAAAEGESAVTVSSNHFAAVSINISARKDGANGFFTWNIQYPATVTNAAVYVYNIGEYYLYDNDYVGRNGYTVNNSQPQTIELSPGYYMMSVRLTTAYRTVAWSEVIHIYANMETKAEKNYTEDDLTRFITLGGTASIMVDDDPVTQFGVEVFRGGHEYDYMVYNWVTINDDGSWEIALPSIEVGTMLFLRLYISTNSFSKAVDLNPVTVTGAYTEFPPINLSFGTITLSGTVTFTGNGAPPQSAYVEVYRVDNDDHLGSIWVYDSNGSWQIGVESFNESTELYFRVRGTDSEGFDFNKKMNDTKWVHNTNVPDINFTVMIGRITLSGTATITINGVPPQFANVWVHRVDNDEVVGYSWINDTNGSWQIGIEPFDTPTEVCFYVYAEDTEGNGFGKRTEVTRTVHNTNISNINFAANISTITLSGTAIITVDGDSSFWNVITAYRVDNDGYLGECSIDPWTGFWQMSMVSFDAPAEVYFRISSNRDNFSEIIDDAILVHNENIPNINFTIDIKTGRITLSGTANITINGVHPQSASISIRHADTGNFINDRSIFVDLDTGFWRTSIDPFDAPTEVYFVVYCEDTEGSSFNKRIDGTRTVYNTNISDINFTVDISAVILSGTATITINGVHPQNAIISISRADTDQWISGNILVDLDTGFWRTGIDPFDAPTEVYFSVSGYDSEGNWFNKTIDGATWVHNTNVPNINFTANISTITLSGTATIRMNGALPQSVEVTARRVDNHQWLGGSSLDLYTGSWQMSIVSFDMPTEVYFEVGADDSEGNMFRKRIDITAWVHNTNVPNINFTVNISTITLSGIANIKVNGAPPNAYVYAYRPDNGEWVGASWIEESGSWRISIEPFDAPVEVRFSVQGYDSEGKEFRIRIDDTRTVYNTNIPNINFTIDINTFVLSGTVDIRVNGSPPQSLFTVDLYTNPDYSGDNWLPYYAVIEPGQRTWAVTVAYPSGHPYTTLYFALWNNDIGTYPLGQSINITGQDISGIDLGTITINTSRSSKQAVPQNGQLNRILERMIPEKQ
jgi:hypothetical protein